MSVVFVTNSSCEDLRRFSQKAVEKATKKDIEDFIRISSLSTD